MVGDLTNLRLFVIENFPWSIAARPQKSASSERLAERLADVRLRRDTSHKVRLERLRVEGDLSMDRRRGDAGDERREQSGRGKPKAQALRHSEGSNPCRGRRQRHQAPPWIADSLSHGEWNW